MKTEYNNNELVFEVCFSEAISLDYVFEKVEYEFCEAEPETGTPEGLYVEDYSGTAHVYLCGEPVAKFAFEMSNPMPQDSYFLDFMRFVEDDVALAVANDHEEVKAIAEDYKLEQQLESIYGRHS